MTRLLIEEGGYSLDVLVDEDADLDGEFEAVCVSTDERLTIRGWMVESVTQV